MKRVDPEVAALRKRFAQHREEQSRAQPQEITPEELHRLSDNRLARQAAELRRIVACHRAEQVLARAAGDKEIFTTLGMLAGSLEKDAKLCEVERRDRAALLKKGQRRTQSKAAAAAPRPGRRPALRELIDDVMRAERCIDFKTFLRRWEGETLGGLRLTACTDGRYTIKDASGDGGSITYTVGYIGKLYSQAR